MSAANSPNSSQFVRILLVDDNSSGLAARRTVLEEHGYSVTTASTAIEALEQCPLDEFDLVITDYKMPHMNGVEFIEKIRSVRPNVPVILISGFADAMGLDERNTGADIVLPKNSNEIPHLLRSVNRLTRKIPRKPAASYGAAVKKRRKSGQST